MVEYDNVQFLGGSDKVEINNANVQACRQFPGMYPTAAGLIATHGPFKEMKVVYNILNMPVPVRNIIKQYEASLVCLPANKAYILDRINNGMYR